MRLRSRKTSEREKSVASKPLKAKLKPKLPQTQNEFDAQYSNLSQSGAYSSKIKKYLNANTIHSLHKPKRRHFKRRKIVVHYRYQICEADLINLRNLAGSNYTYKYILLMIDLFSKKIWLRKLKTKSGEETANAFKNIFENMEYTPQTLIFDEGKEFLNKYCDLLFKQFNIHYYHLMSGNFKAGAAERANRTIKGLLWKQFDKQSSQNWTKTYLQIQDLYNSTYHSSIKMSPDQVSNDNRDEVFKALYPNIEDRIKCRLKETDRVRIALRKSSFEKSYTHNWSKEIFEITKVLQRNGVCWYKLKALDGTPYPKSKLYFDLNLVSSK